MPKEETLPTISVILTTHNRVDQLPTAISSILEQTWHDYELIIVDDASEDNTPFVVEKIQLTDKRIHYIRLFKNVGLWVARNIGIQNARGKYVAVIDDDDISLPLRLEKQVTFLEANPDISILGVHFVTIDENDREIRSFQYPLTHGLIRWGLIFSCQLHAVMMKREIFSDEVNLYREFPSAEDYDLWVRLASRYKMANLLDVLYLYRKHQKSISNLSRNTQKYSSFVIIREQINSMVGVKLSNQLIMGLLDSSQINKIKDARYLSNVIVKLVCQTETWDIAFSDRLSIRRTSAAKLRSIWFAQKMDIRLLLYVIYSLYLYPQVIMRKLIPKIFYE